MHNKERAKSVQNFFKFYGILSDSRKNKNDRKRSRIKGFVIFNPKRSDVRNGDGGSRTHVQRYRHLSIYERSRYIWFRCIFRLPTGLRAASLVRLFPRPQAADSGVAHSL
jgi:hypothetical protein